MTWWQNGDTVTKWRGKDDVVAKWKENGEMEGRRRNAVSINKKKTI